MTGTINRKAVFILNLDEERLSVSSNKIVLDIGNEDFDEGVGWQILPAPSSECDCLPVNVQNTHKSSTGRRRWHMDAHTAFAVITPTRDYVRLCLRREIQNKNASGKPRVATAQAESN